jgi:hypothetical protein
MRKSYFKTYYLLIFIFWCEIEEECAKEEVREGERIYISARSARPALMRFLSLVLENTNRYTPYYPVLPHEKKTSVVRSSFS